MPGTITGDGTPDWTNGNKTPIPTSCSYLQLTIIPKVTNFASQTQFLMQYSFNGKAPITDGSYSFSDANNGATFTMFNLMVGTNNAASSIVTAWAPVGCTFKDTTNQNTFLALNLGANITTTGYQCSVTPSNLTVICDSNGSTSRTSDGALADPNKAGGKAGDAPFGYVAGVSYTASDVAKFTSNTFTHIKRTFDGPNCTGNLASTMTETGTYQLQPVDAPGTIPINLIKSTKIGTIYDDSSVGAANNDPGSNGCGFSDWVAGTQKDLVSSTCSSARTTDYSRIKIDGSKMYFCDHGATATAGNDYGSSPANRVPDCSNITVGDFLQKN